MIESMLHSGNFPPNFFDKPTPSPSAKTENKAPQMCGHQTPAQRCLHSRLEELLTQKRWNAETSFQTNTVSSEEAPVSTERTRQFCEIHVITGIWGGELILGIQFIEFSFLPRKLVSKKSHFLGGLFSRNVLWESLQWCVKDAFNHLLHWLNQWETRWKQSPTWKRWLRKKALLLQCYLCGSAQPWMSVSRAEEIRA